MLSVHADESLTAEIEALICFHHLVLSLFFFF